MKNENLKEAKKLLESSEFEESMAFSLLAIGEELNRLNDRLAQWSSNSRYGSGLRVDKRG